MNSPGVFLTIHILSIVGFVQFLRFGQIRGASMPAVISLNYLAATMANVIYAGMTGESIWLNGNPVVITCGVSNGFLYAFHLVVVLQCFKRFGTGVTSAVMTIGIIIPVFMSRLFWNEAISTFQWIGLFMVPVVAFLIHVRNDSEEGYPGMGSIYLFLNFFIAGTIGTIHKQASIFTENGNTVLYQICLFSTAFILCFAYLVAKKKKPTSFDLWTGLVVGILNVGATASLILSLGSLQAALVFPVSRCTSVILNLVLGVTFWSEKLRTSQVFGLSLGILVVLLVTLG